MRRRIGVVTVARSDYGLYYPVLRRIQQQDCLELQLIAAAAHLSPTWGDTVREIETDGFPVAARVPMALESDSRSDIASCIGKGVQEFAQVLNKLKPDLLLVLGDRYEMFAAAIAALPLRVPVAHIQGGELTEGAIDDSIRHAITKLSHIHFAATAQYARRIKQLGEESWRVHVSGSPAIDSIHSTVPIPEAKLEEDLGLHLDTTILVTYHPVTLDRSEHAGLNDLLQALSRTDLSLLITYPNADANCRHIIEELERFASRRLNTKLVSSLGHHRFHSVQKYVRAMIGNSSSGIIEAATFRLPVVNIGSRQDGRLRPANVIDCPPIAEEIERAIAKALSPAFKESIADLKNPYGDGHAAERIVSTLASLECDERLLRKKFIDYADEHF